MQRENKCYLLVWYISIWAHAIWADECRFQILNDHGLPGCKLLLSSMLLGRRAGFLCADGGTYELYRYYGILGLIKNLSLKLKLQKCKFAQSQVKLLRHKANKTGVAVDPYNVEAIHSIPLPKAITELHRFPVLACYYRHFIYGFATISAQLCVQTFGRISDATIWSSEL